MCVLHLFPEGQDAHLLVTSASIDYVICSGLSLYCRLNCFQRHDFACLAIMKCDMPAFRDPVGCPHDGPASPACTTLASARMYSRLTPRKGDDIAV